MNKAKLELETWFIFAQTCSNSNIRNSNSTAVKNSYKEKKQPTLLVYIVI